MFIVVANLQFFLQFELLVGFFFFIFLSIFFFYLIFIINFASSIMHISKEFSRNPQLFYIRLFRMLYSVVV